MSTIKTCPTTKISEASLSVQLPKQNTLKQGFIRQASLETPLECIFCDVSGSSIYDCEMCEYCNGKHYYYASDKLPY